MNDLNDRIPIVPHEKLGADCCGCLIVRLREDQAKLRRTLRWPEVIQKEVLAGRPALNPRSERPLATGGREYNERAVEAMLGRAYNMCHVKDTVEGESGQLARVDLGKMFEPAKQRSYRGFYSMEFDTDAGDPVAGTKHLIVESLRYLA